jgi:HEAT repeat protein
VNCPAEAPAASVDQAAWTTLDKALLSGNPDHRRQALTALGSIGASNRLALQKVEQGLRDKDPVVRGTAAAVLGQMHATEAIPLLKEALDDNDEVAFSAAKALADMGDTGGRHMFIAVLAGERKDSAGLITSSIRDARAKLRHPEQLALIGAKEASGAFLGPASMGIVVAQDVFRDGGATGRALAATEIAKGHDPYTLTLLEWALGDSNWLVRAAAAKGVGEHGNADSIPRLQSLLGDDHNGARTMAAAAIIRILSREKQPSIQSADRAAQ